MRDRWCLELVGRFVPSRYRVYVVPTRRRTFALAGAVVLLSIGGVLFAPQHRASAGTGADSSAVGNCVPIAPSAIEPGALGSTTYVFTDDLGHRVTQIMSPTGWVPAAATSQELHAYGLPPRPTSSEGAADWDHVYGSIRSFAAPGICESTTDSSPLPSGNWSGVLLYNGDFSKVVGEEVEPTYQAVCPTASAHSHWVGFGGYYSRSLIQAGVDNIGTFTLQGGRYAFYEYLNSSYDSHETHLNLTISEGNRTTYYVTYSGGTSSFAVVNQTTGVSTSPTSVAGLSAYYDGSTAEYIDEAPTHNGAQTQLRKWGTTAFWDYMTAQQPGQVNKYAGLYTFDGVYMQSQTNPGTTMAGPDSGMSNDRSFRNYWHQCS